MNLPKSFGFSQCEGDANKDKLDGYEKPTANNNDDDGKSFCEWSE